MNLLNLRLKLKSEFLSFNFIIFPHISHLKCETNDILRENYLYTIAIFVLHLIYADLNKNCFLKSYVTVRKYTLNMK